MVHDVTVRINHFLPLEGCITKAHFIGHYSKGPQITFHLSIIEEKTEYVNKSTYNANKIRSKERKILYEKISKNVWFNYKINRKHSLLKTFSVYITWKNDIYQYIIFLFGITP